MNAQEAADVLKEFDAEALEKLAAWVTLQAFTMRRDTGNVMSAKEIADKLCKEAESR